MDLKTAEIQIAKILSELERDTNTIVLAVTLDSTESTHIESTRREYQMMVVIELQRLPGHDWYTGEKS